MELNFQTINMNLQKNYQYENYLKQQSKEQVKLIKKKTDLQEYIFSKLQKHKLLDATRYYSQTVKNHQEKSSNNNGQLEKINQMSMSQLFKKQNNFRDVNKQISRFDNQNSNLKDQQSLTLSIQNSENDESKNSMVLPTITNHVPSQSCEIKIMDNTFQGARSFMNNQFSGNINNVNSNRSNHQIQILDSFKMKRNDLHCSSLKQKIFKDGNNHDILKFKYMQTSKTKFLKESQTKDLKVEVQDRISQQFRSNLIISIIETLSHVKL